MAFKLKMWDTKQKYVRLEQYDEIIIFPTTIEHSTFRHLKPISAGFCRVHSDKVVCFGDSYALSLESKEDDTAIATRQFYGIDAMLELH